MDSHIRSRPWSGGISQAVNVSPANAGSDVKSTPETPKNVCFGCKKPGHWIRQCPEKSKQSPRSSDLGIDASVPEKACACGRGLCLVRISRTDMNPNRKFYCCPVTMPGMKCRFFQWCNSPSPSRYTLNIDFSLYPMCACGAGKAILSVTREGVDAGRQCFICPIKRGQGACNFFQWVDDLIREKERPMAPVDPNKSADSSRLNGVHDVVARRTEAGQTINGDPIVFNANRSLLSSPMTGSNPGIGILLGEQVEDVHSMVARKLSFEDAAFRDVGGPGKIRAGNCYGCGQPGHWMEDCPSLT